MKCSRYILFIIAAFISNYSSAQFTFTESISANELAKVIAGQGVTVTNAVFTGNALSSAKFIAAKGSFGIDSGIVLSSGFVRDISQSAFSTANGTSGAAGDNDLNSYINSTTLDAAVLEFDFIPQGDTLKVKYVFASDEYPQYNCSEYNDAFAFLINGPGITGIQNIALVPNTNIPVTINSINNGVVSNEGDFRNCRNLGSGSPFTNLYVSNTQSYLAFNGHTVVLEAKVAVLPCHTYHIKLAIADAIDRLIDSGVFIEAGSFSSNGGFNFTTNSYLTDAANNILVEGCKSTDVVITRTKDFNLQQTVNFSYSGSAELGIDYSGVPSSVVFMPNDTTKSFTLRGTLDNNAEADETIIIDATVVGDCNATSVSTMEFILKDSIVFSSNTDTFVCSAFNTTLIAQRDTAQNADNKYLWNTGVNSQSIIINAPGVYAVKHTYEDRCARIDSFTVVNGDPVLSVTPDPAIFCEGETIQLTANSSAGNIIWNTGDVINTISINTPGTYSVRATGSNGCYVSESVLASQNPKPKVNLGTEMAYCPYETVELKAGFFAGATYLWSTGETTPSIKPRDSAVYWVNVTLNDCVSSDSVLVYVKKMPVANAGLDKEILKGGSVILRAEKNSNNKTYQWSPSAFLNVTNTPDVISNPHESISYFLKVTSPQGCVDTDTVHIKVIDKKLVIPNAFSPNGDGVNDFWSIPFIESFINAKIQVFNRSGQVVYTANAASKPWDGSYNGKPVPGGVYYYIIEGLPNMPKQSGSLTILR